jgi:hypothetical protein
MNIKELWQKENKYYEVVPHDKTYNNILLHTGSCIKGQWENSMVVINDDKIIKSSNHYIEGFTWNEPYNRKYKIYDNLLRNYYELTQQNKKINYELYDKNTMFFYMITAFCFSNSGHDLSAMLNYVHYILEKKIKDILILKGYKETNNFKLIEKLLPSDCIFYELEFNTIYSIKNTIILSQAIMDTLAHPYLVERLRNYVKNNYSNLYEDCKNKNIILMKTNRNSNVNLQSTQIHCEKMLLKLESKGFINIIPEETDVFKLCTYLLYANSIIFSTGSVLFTNKLFFNEKSIKIYLHNTDKPSINCHKVDINLRIIYVNTNFDLNDKYLDYIQQIKEMIVKI